MAWLILGFIAFVVVLGLLALRSTPTGRGRIGESRVARVLSRLDSASYSVINDLLLPVSNGESSQIDHVIVSLYGIFVLETKNYQGWIFGGEKSETWTQVIYNTKTRFRNPIKQNWSHIYALKEILQEFPSLPFIPIVVFAGTARLKKIRARSPVVYLSQLMNTIQENSKIQCLTPDDLDTISGLLRSQNCVGKTARTEHVKSLKKKELSRQENKKRLICPKCHGKLTLRKGAYGEFYGCSEYPRCTFTLPKKK